MGVAHRGHGATLYVPQPGQRIPKITRIEQGGRPSCWWVPKPWELGSSRLATSNSTSGVRATVRAVRRNAPFRRDGDVGGREWRPPLARGSAEEGVSAGVEISGKVTALSDKVTAILKPSKEISTNP